MTSEDDRRPQPKPADADNAPAVDDDIDALDRYSDQVTGYGLLPATGMGTPAHYDSHARPVTDTRRVDRGDGILETRPGGVTVFTTKDDRDRTWG